MPAPTLPTFLETARATLNDAIANPGTQLTFVTGNSSADLDSFASAYSYAYLASHFTSQTGVLPSQQPLIPLLCIPREDLQLRRDFLGLLGEIGVTQDHLLFLDDIAQLKGKHKLFLVDHNVQWPTAFPADKFDVVGIIDHHEDAGQHTHVQPRHIVVPCGSCASLVVQWFGWPAEAAWGPPGDDDAVVAASQVARLAMAAVTVDTANLRNKKTEQWDRDAAATLQRVMDTAVREDGPAMGAYVAADGTWDRARFAEWLENLKADVSGFGLADILNKDFKSSATVAEIATTAEGAQKRKWTLGVSSVSKPLRYLLAHFNDGAALDAASERAKAVATPNKLPIPKTMLDFGIKKKLDVVVIMTNNSSEPGDKGRELFVWVLPQEISGIDEASARVWVKKVKDVGKDYLKLAKLQNDGALLDGLEGKKEDKTRRAWKQEAGKKSRKQVLPMLEKIGSEHEGEGEVESKGEKL